MIDRKEECSPDGRLRKTKAAMLTLLYLRAPISEQALIDRNEPE